MLRELIEQNGWLDVPDEIVSREGHRIDTSGDEWRLAHIGQTTNARFSRVRNSLLRWAIKRAMIRHLKVTSTHAGARVWVDVSAEVLSRQGEFRLTEDISADALRERLVALMEAAISDARASHRLWALYRVVRWYVWCADNFPEIGFCPQYANELDGMSIPSNPKGEAVRSDDPEEGPLNRTLESPLLITALERDTSTAYEHLQQKAAVALCIALGRNPANLIWLNDEDLVNEVEGIEGVDPCYVLHVPRIKKRQLNPRDDFIPETLDIGLARHVIKLIEANRAVDTTILTNQGPVTIAEKPLFVRRHRLPAVVPMAQAATVFRVASSRIASLLRRFVARHNIVSPVTDGLLVLTPRRLRYTLATALVEEGISRSELARILDHSDTQHVEVYFALKGRVVRFLDEATAKRFGQYLAHFKGRIVDAAEEAINGERDDKHLTFINEADPEDQTEIGVCGEAALCHLDPPYSCYLCPKFQPYRHADHEHVLQCLLNSREERMERYEAARLGVQLDSVIFAVGQVVEVCRAGDAVDG
jgi:integrase